MTTTGITAEDKRRRTFCLMCGACADTVIAPTCEDGGNHPWRVYPERPAHVNMGSFGVCPETQTKEAT